MPNSYYKKIFFLCIVLAIGRFAFDMYIPSLGIIANEFKVEYGVIEQTMASFLLGITFSQLLFGPLADYWGRRYVLLLGFSIFIFGSLVCIFSNSADMLIIGRFLCGAGLSVGPCLKRALLVDWFANNKKLLFKASGAVSSSLMFATMIAPYIGGVLQEYLGSWRLSFTLIAIWGALLALYIGLLFKDKYKVSSAFSAKVVIVDYTEILLNGNFIFYALACGFVFANMMVYFQLIPHIFTIDLLTSAKQIGYAASFAGLSYIIGGFILPFINTDCHHRLIIKSLVIMAVAGLLASIIFQVCDQKIWLIVPLFWFFVSVRWMMPAVMAEAMSSQQKSGTASAVLGFIQYLFSSILSFAFGFIGAELSPYVWFSQITLGSIGIIIYMHFAGRTANLIENEGNYITKNIS
jgi:DHA1 family bicyclomycin/chloramphenicol resistance-like MFS transporter